MKLLFCGENNMTQVELLQEKLIRAREEAGKVIVGQDDILDSLFVALLTGGHALLIGVPGLAKTLMIHTLARVIQGSFNRIQFTPDLMPSDITGIELVQDDKETGEKVFRFVKGPVFCNILLADEINRTPPKTQSALLQAMQEKTVSQGDKTWELEDPFFVLATQNPIEQEGTYPLPEAQLDRFTFSLKMRYPNFEDEVKIAVLENVWDKEVLPQLNVKELLEMQDCVAAMPMGDEVVRYAVRINFATRADSEYATEMVKKYISWGSGPRASQFMVRAARARAFMQGKSSVDVDDVRFVAPLVLQHRLVMNFQGEAEGIRIEQIIENILDAVR
jgi:MoxR-like ATPase